MAKSTERYRWDYRRNADGSDEWVVVDTRTGTHVGDPYTSPGAAEAEARSRNRAWDAERKATGE